MNKMIIFLIISTVIMSSVSGLLFYQLNVVQTEKNELKDELFELKNRLNGEQNHSRVIENQVAGLQNQTEQLEQSLVELENQRNQLEEQISKATNKVKITEVCAHGFGSIVGWLYESEVDVTLENFGINDVENLVVIIEMNSSDHFTSTHNVTIIQTSEELVISGRVWYTMEDMSIGLIVITLELNNQTIDNYMISINEALNIT